MSTTPDDTKFKVTEADEKFKHDVEIRQMDLQSKHWQIQQDYWRNAHESQEEHRQENQRHWRHMRYYWIVIAILAGLAVWSKWSAI